MHMTLNRRYRRSIKSNLPFYIAASVLTMLALLRFYLFYIAGTGINEFGDQFFSKQKVEDASFTTYQPIPDENIDQIEDKYDLTFEKERWVNAEEDEFHARIFVPNRQIDLYEIQTISLHNRRDLLV